MYLESNKTGPTATIKGNTVPADITKYGTVAEGLYTGSYQKYKGDGAIIINDGKDDKNEREHVNALLDAFLRDTKAKKAYAK